MPALRTGKVEDCTRTSRQTDFPLALGSRTKRWKKYPNKVHHPRISAVDLFIQNCTDCFVVSIALREGRVEKRILVRIPAVNIEPEALRKIPINEIDGL